MGRPPYDLALFCMRVLIKLGLVRVCAFVYANSKPPSGVGVVRGVGRVLFISRLRLMCKCAKSDCIIMQMLPLGAQYTSNELLTHTGADGEGQKCLWRNPSLAPLPIRV